MRNSCMHLILLLLLGLIFPCSAFSQFSLQATIRPRGEARYGYKTLPADTAVAAKFISQRTRLNLHYQQPEYEMGLSFQDVRTWGDASIYSATGAKADPATIDLHEAWFACYPGEKTAIKVGRQEWVYDDQRLLSKKAWNNHGMSYDGVLIKYRIDQLDIHLAGSWNNDREDLLGDSFTSEKLKTLNFLYLKKPFAPWLEVSFLGILSGFKSIHYPGELPLNFRVFYPGKACAFFLGRKLLLSKRPQQNRPAGRRMACSCRSGIPVCPKSQCTGRI
mgnify:CR=1 FL=1